MSSRITRSSARQSASSASLSNIESTKNSSEQAQPATKDKPPATARKRKASAADLGTSVKNEEQEVPASTHRSKRVKQSQPEVKATASASKRQKKSKATGAMASPGEQTKAELTQQPPQHTSSSSKKKSGKAKAVATDSADTPTTKRSKKVSKKSENRSKETSNPPTLKVETAVKEEKTEMSEEDEDDDPEGRHYDDGDEEMEEHDFEGWLGGAGGAGGPGGPGGSGLSSTLRALTGMMAGMNGRFRGMLDNLKQKDDPSMQLIGLQTLSETLLVSTEDTLAGHFSPEVYLKELVPLMQPNDFTGEENPEMMLLACRCIANMMEALPASTASVVYGGAVPVLLSKLIEIQYMDLAEQALLTLEKISVEFPSSIVREGGLAACLTYLDFFPTSTQRTAVTTAANCCRNIPGDSYASVKDVMPILQNVLDNNDQRVVEQGCLCVSRIVESFKYEDSRLEGLMSADLLRAILRLLVPGTTNMIGPNIQTQFLKVLGHTARASPALTAELFKMNVVETLFQMLTGVSPPSGVDDVAHKIDSLMIMQALIHRPKDQIFETLNVICELLPDKDNGNLGLSVELADLFADYTQYNRTKRTSQLPVEDKLASCKPELRRFAVVLFPTLTDAYSSTVNLNVRQKVLIAQIKMLSDLDVDILEDALRSVPYASFLASVLSQQDHPHLVVLALRATELLLKRLETIYRYQFYREGVIAEVRKLAERPLSVVEPSITASAAAASETLPRLPSSTITPPIPATSRPDHADSEHDSDDDDQDDDMGDGHDDEDDQSSDEEDISATTRLPRSISQTMQDLITKYAQRFLVDCESEQGAALRDKAASRLQEMQSLVTDIAAAYESGNTDGGAKLFRQLAQYFDGDALDSITSHELMTSKLVERLLDIFQDADGQPNELARAAFVDVFMGTTISSRSNSVTTEAPATPFSSLVHKLQDLLSRAEHFEVLTVHSGSSDSSRSSAVSMLAKQIRVKLVADEESGIPRPYRNITVSIHAIATFKALDDYLRPRISMVDRPRPSRTAQDTESLTGALSAVMDSLTNATPDAAKAPATTTPAQPGSESQSRQTSRKSSRSKSRTSSKAHSSAKPETPSADTTSARKSRHKSKSSQSTDVATPIKKEPDESLECADETQLADDDEELDDETLNAIVDDLEDEVETEEADPTAVNLEVASSGKVTARQDDGTRIATPTQGSTPTKPPAQKAYSSEMARSLLSQLSGRAMSYAAALQSTPQDWHLEFNVNGQHITNETTIYRAVHQMQTTSGEAASRNIWSAVHSISIKKVVGPPPAESDTLHSTPEPAPTTPSGLPQSLEDNPETATILRLLGILHDINNNLDDVMIDLQDTQRFSPEPLTQFVNTKLTAKLNRQLEEPLVVASNCLPSWSEDLARLYPFLFPFETRHFFLQSTSFGYSRSMNRWQDAQTTSDSRRNRHRDERPYLGRLQRQKVRISRNKILESAVKVMELYGASPSILEVEYFEEVGTGLGPTLEFYSTVSKEFSKRKFRMWRENDSNLADEFAFGKRGLYPIPMSEAQSTTENGQKVLTLFKMLGKFVARSMLDSRIIDVSLNPAFFRFDRNAGIPPLSTIKAVDQDLFKSLLTLRQFYTAKRAIEEHPRLTATQKEQKISLIQIAGATIDDLALDFTLPGYPNIEIIPSGAQIPVTIENVAMYIAGVVDYTTGRGVQKQIEAFRTGFSQVFPYSALSAFTAEELTMLFGRVEEDWSMETLMDSLKADHGFNLDSPAVRNLLQVMTELSANTRRDFLQFVTGSPKLPIGGFKSLSPMLTVVCKPAEPPHGSDDYLPSVMTCVNYLKLPNYSTLEVMRNKVMLAIKEGQGAFHLS